MEAGCKGRVFLFTAMTKYYSLILIGAGILIGIGSTLIVQRCDVETAMKPLYYVIGELGGKCR